MDGRGWVVGGGMERVSSQRVQREACRTPNTGGSENRLYHSVQLKPKRSAVHLTGRLDICLSEPAL